MNYIEFTKSMVMYFIASLIITIMLWFFLTTLHIEYVQYLAAFVGMYVFACFGVNRAVDDKLVPDNYWRFVLAIVCIIVFGFAFLYLMPIVFGADIFQSPLTFSLGDSNVVLTAVNCLEISALIVLVANYFDYK